MNWYPNKDKTLIPALKKREIKGFDEISVMSCYDDKRKTNLFTDGSKKSIAQSFTMVWSKLKNPNRIIIIGMNKTQDFNKLK